jgi:hypothetical protein
LNTQESISKLISLLKGEEARWPMLLLGAGASFRSGVPTASGAVKQIAKTVYSEKVLKGARHRILLAAVTIEPNEREETISFAVLGFAI